MDGGAYAPIVYRILKSGRWVGSDGGKVAQEWFRMKVSICGERFPVDCLESCEREEWGNRGLTPIDFKTATLTPLTA